jgi:hypothetical protein
MGDTLIAYMHRDEVATSFAQSLTELCLADRGEHIAETTNVRCNAGDVPIGRNQTAKYFLENAEFQWLCFIDSDMGFGTQALHLLHEAADPVERPIVGALCFAQRDLVRDGRHGYRWEARPTIFDFTTFPDGKQRFAFRTHYPVNGILQCDGTGAAFLLIHRSVMAAMLNEYGPVWFDRILDPDGLMSEDLSFFKRWMEMRGKGGCHVHTGAKTTHYKPVWLSDQDFWQQAAVPPAVQPVDVIVPVLHRPQNVRPFLETLKASTGLATAWFVCEPGDREEMDEVRRYGGKVIQQAGTFAEKMNYGYDYTYTRRGAKVGSAAPYIFMVGDDVMFQPGWLDHAEFVANYYKADVVGTNDLGNPRVQRGDHATHLLIRRSYVDSVGASWDGPGTVCHEGYRHWYVDDEIVTAAQQRQVWQMALGSIVEHMHPLWGKGVEDDVYRLGREAADKDEVVFGDRAVKFGAVA